MLFTWKGVLEAILNPEESKEKIGRSHKHKNGNEEGDRGEVPKEEKMTIF